MLIREFTEQEPIDLESVDLLDDLQFFMNNDPAFYRKVYYPVLSQMKNTVKEGAQCSDDMFRPCVDKAVDIYCKKFNLPGNIKSVFTDVDRDELARKIFSQELDNIDQGQYN
jgi:hypothetical protein